MNVFTKRRLDVQLTNQVHIKNIKRLSTSVHTELPKNQKYMHEIILKEQATAGEGVGEAVAAVVGAEKGKEKEESERCVYACV